MKQKIYRVGTEMGDGFVEFSACTEPKFAAKAKALLEANGWTNIQILESDVPLNSVTIDGVEHVLDAEEESGSSGNEHCVTAGYEGEIYIFVNAENADDAYEKAMDVYDSIFGTEKVDSGWPENIQYDSGFMKGGYAVSADGKKYLYEEDSTVDDNGEFEAVAKDKNCNYLVLAHIDGYVEVSVTAKGYQGAGKKARTALKKLTQNIDSGWGNNAKLNIINWHLMDAVNEDGKKHIFN